MRYTEKITESCTNCGSSECWMVESHMAFIMKDAVSVVCGDCYDGVPDSGMTVGRGKDLHEALADWQSQWEEE